MSSFARASDESMFAEPIRPAGEGNSVNDFELERFAAERRVKTTRRGRYPSLGLNREIPERERSQRIEDKPQSKLTPQVSYESQTDHRKVGQDKSTAGITYRRVARPRRMIT